MRAVIWNVTEGIDKAIFITSGGRVTSGRRVKDVERLRYIPSLQRPGRGGSSSSERISGLIEMRSGRERHDKRYFHDRPDGVRPPARRAFNRRSGPIERAHSGPAIAINAGC